MDEISSTVIPEEEIQVHGGSGNSAEGYYRDARVTKIHEGTGGIQKNVIANQIR